MAAFWQSGSGCWNAPGGTPAGGSGVPCERIPGGALTAALAAAFLNGSFAAFARARRVRAAQVRGKRCGQGAARATAGGGAAVCAQTRRSSVPVPHPRPQVPPHVFSFWAGIGFVTITAPLAWIVGLRVRRSAGLGWGCVGRRRGRRHGPRRRASRCPPSTLTHTRMPPLDLDPAPSASTASRC
jgi:hypothetical protein